ncbi:TrmH family RNA methyltransferase [Ligilactobacillus pobuzihii]|uniref:23S rRNA methyltransferase n=1 Tax=Ligilactobacillus pobuzihii TaxID=449659 RepID=A0A0R2LRS0_9LACO|nr:RNA methyltransferase [Ligilactobacillus pobuzihii]KRK11368.1 23S rRNA methyltransferase [Ligilactobacillus pobuzihii E100301 = KCTC 13174]KRO02683.1 23S rRNA methyltransferase [Ligilactobacillus pobuzihii]GEN47364.1 23S rRNA methyltransferase [Ligilactobacillus pobuzihii]
MKYIQSTGNQSVKNWKKLQTKKGRSRQNKYLLEGWHLVNEAIKANKNILEIMATTTVFEQTSTQNLWPEEIERFEISDEVAHQLSATPSPQGVFATVSLDDELKISPTSATGAWLFLDTIQDPGNVGTMVRTADAAGFSGVVLSQGSVDMYQPKLVRSMQGSQFHIQLVEGDLREWTAAFKKNHFPVFGSELNEQARRYDQVGRHEDFALVMGNEGNGLSQEMLSETSMNLYIPLTGQAESLNVAIAAGILMFKLRA